ncbi:MAG: AlpA family phage regulatory protein [Rhizobiales bacterium]|nr:AlpA family phage regulatory protein [Hyphomicrobiales bacterium]
MQLLDRDALKAKGVPYSKVHLWRLVKTGTFPRPVKLSSAAPLLWVESEIDAWLESQVAKRDQVTEAAA